jgi:hypothetical protein
MEKFPTRASPEDGGKSMVSILIVVLLPAPFEPSKPKISPALADNVKESTAVNSPKRRVRGIDFNNWAYHGGIVKSQQIPGRVTIAHMSTGTHWIWACTRN